MDPIFSLARLCRGAYGEEVTEVPEADAQEQTIPIDPDDEETFTPAIGDDVPEADAVEQAIPVPLDDEDWD
jgi:hypothetical protein